MCCLKRWPNTALGHQMSLVGEHLISVCTSSENMSSFQVWVLHHRGLFYERPINLSIFPFFSVYLSSIHFFDLLWSRVLSSFLLFSLFSFFSPPLLFSFWVLFFLSPPLFSSLFRVSFHSLILLFNVLTCIELSGLVWQSEILLNITTSLSNQT